MVMFPKISEIKRLRVKSGLSQSIVAKKIGVSQSAIAKYENGTQIPSYEIAVELFQLLLESEVINEPTLSEVMHGDIYYLAPDDSLASAIDAMKTASISQIPIREKSGQIVGTINESRIVDLLSQYHNLDQFKQEKIETIMDEPMPIIPGEVKITEVSALLKRFGGVLISSRGKIIGIVTKSDLLNI